MCTVSLVPLVDGVRIACNRDEQRSRPVADPPRVRRAGARTAVYPVDPVSGGTWIGVNNAGLALALLNRHHTGLARGPSAATRSRGTLIPELLATGTVAETRRRLATLVVSNTAVFEPFTLIAVHGADLGHATYDGGELSFEIRPLDRPSVFTSSSLGDALVSPPRRALFAALVERSARPLQGQARFHRHHWSKRPDVSVRMSRPDAATVSFTVLDVRATRIRVRYQRQL